MGDMDVDGPKPLPDSASLARPNALENDYRLVVSIAYRLGVVYVKFIGTHSEYDKIDADTVDME